MHHRLTPGPRAQRETTAIANLAAAFLAAGLALAPSGCGPSAPAPGGAATAAAQTERVIRTTFYPTTYFAERIAGGLVPVECPLPEGEDPIFWEPDAATVNAYQRAAITIVNGAEFEKWAITAPLPRSRVLETTQGFTDPFITIEGVTHSHGPAGEHSHDGVDGHTWMDPMNAIAQATAIADGLADAFPEHAGAFRANLAPLTADLRALHDRAAALDLSGVVLLASHPAYNYLARRHGWAVTSFDMDPVAELTTADIERLAAGVGAGKSAVLLWESAPLASTEAALRGFGITSVLFSPAESLDPASKAAGRDYLSIMRENFDRLEAALKP